MIAFAILISLSGDASPSFACAYSYAAAINAPIKTSSANVQALTDGEARAAIRRIVESAGFILEGCACKRN